MKFNRRTFLKQSALTLLLLGLDTKKLFSSARSYRQALAESNQRKIALLVGINQYPQGNALQGCVTDVELQKDLLINRFGFNPQDILTLTNQEATRVNIETAFIEHLIKPVTENDIVIFHFSGYGSEVLYPTASGLINSIVPSDGLIYNQNEPQCNDILEDTLILLGSSLATSSLHMILDTSYQNQDQIKSGNFRLRVCPPSPFAKYPNPEEIQFQEQLKLKIKELQKRKILTDNAPFLGTILNAATFNHSALETNFNGFSAGIFTYCLTQFLWETTPANTLYFTIKKVTEKMTNLVETPQQPSIVKTGKQPQWFYQILPKKEQVGIGFIVGLEEEGKTIILKLNGVSPTLISHYNINSIVTVESDNSQGILLQLKSKNGLMAKAKIISPVTPEQNVVKIGQVVRENWRFMPTNLGLTVALDHNLSRIEKVDATSAFANIKNVTSVVNLDETNTDCILSKDDSSNYQLSNPRGMPIATINQETIKSALKKINEQFDFLLGKKLLILLHNEATSNLKIEAVLNLTKPKKQKLLIRETGKSLSPNIITPHLPQTPLTDLNIPILRPEDNLEYHLENHGDRPLYFMLLAIENNQLLIFADLQINQENNTVSIAKKIGVKETLKIPLVNISENQNINERKKLVYHQLIFSDAPLVNTSKLFQNLNKTGFIPVSNPLETIRNIWQDLHNNSINQESAPPNSSSDFYTLNINHWASFSFTYQT